MLTKIVIGLTLFTHFTVTFAIVSSSNNVKNEDNKTITSGSYKPRCEPYPECVYFPPVDESVFKLINHDSANEMINKSDELTTDEKPNDYYRTE